MTKNKKENDLIALFDELIVKMRTGHKVQRNGKRVSKGTIKIYQNISRHLKIFSVKYDFRLNAKSAINLNQKELKKQKNYWKRFYRLFTSYLYDDLKLYDNYVASLLKAIRTFFNYLKDEKFIDLGLFQKQFYILYDEIQIVVLSPERLNELIHSTKLDLQLNVRQKEARGFFIVGCTVALRFSDLRSLRPENIECAGENYFLCTRSQKTQTITRVRLPKYVINILNLYKNQKSKYILPQFQLGMFNVTIREVLQIAGYTEAILKVRNRRGVPYQLFKNKSKKEGYRFCDLVTSHTMRRTAITTMLSLGMKEEMVRKISGHSANSKEFYKYVAFSQAYLDTEIGRIHQIMEKPL